MADQPRPLPETSFAGQPQDLVLQCEDAEELLRELAAFSATALSTHAGQASKALGLAIRIAQLAGDRKTVAAR